MMKRLVRYTLCFCLLFNMVAPLSVKADSKTLRDYKNELKALQSQQQENKRMSDSAYNEIKYKKDFINSFSNTIDANEKSVEESKQKIIESEALIVKTTEELHDVFSYMQSIDEDKVYLEFIVQSTTMSDFLERAAIIEQLSSYQDSEIHRLEQLIADNKQLQIDLNNQNENLEKSITEYEKKIEELQALIESLASVGLDYNEQIKAQKELIKTYEDAGCRDEDSIDYCYYSKIVNASKFVRPLAKGRVTQTYGNNGHKGIDLGGNKSGTAMFAAAPGVVASVSYHNSCGGNIVHIHHYVNGVAYTSEYAHMHDIYVKVGETVTAATQIGTVGGGKDTEYYDRCTFGEHLHFTIAFGLYLGSGNNGYRSYSTFQSKSTPTGDQKVTGIKNTKGYSWSSRY